MMTIADLVAAGFKKEPVTWSTDAAGKLHLIGEIPKAAGVYLFVVGVSVRYVGKTDSALHSRMRSYVRGVQRSLRQRAVHKGIKAEICKGETVDLYTFTFTGAGQRFGNWNGLPIDRLVGLESGLIEKLNPCWNPFNAAGRSKRTRAQSNSSH
jgi:hypothetical protein